MFVCLCWRLGFRSITDSPWSLKPVDYVKTIIPQWGLKDRCFRPNLFLTGGWRIVVKSSLLLKLMSSSFIQTDKTTDRSWSSHPEVTNVLNLQEFPICLPNYLLLMSNLLSLCFVLTSVCLLCSISNFNMENDLIFGQTNCQAQFMLKI